MIQFSYQNVFDFKINQLFLALGFYPILPKILNWIFSDYPGSDVILST